MHIHTITLYASCICRGQYYDSTCESWLTVAEVSGGSVDASGVELTDVNVTRSMEFTVFTEETRLTTAMVHAVLHHLTTAEAAATATE